MQNYALSDPDRKNWITKPMFKARPALDDTYLPPTLLP